MGNNMDKKQEDIELAKAKANIELLRYREKKKNLEYKPNRMFILKASIVVIIIIMGIKYYANHHTPLFLKTFSEAQAYCQKKGETLPGKEDISHLPINGHMTCWLNDGSYFSVTQYQTFGIESIKAVSPDERHWADCIKEHFDSPAVSLNAKR